MQFDPIASSSQGNAYLVTSQGLAPLLIEAGVTIKKLRRDMDARGLSIVDLSACLISHEHL